MCFVRNENGNKSPGGKGLCHNMVTRSFQNMKNKFTLKKKKKNEPDSFILFYVEASPLSLATRISVNKRGRAGREDSCAPIVPLRVLSLPAHACNSTVIK
jgi:hypothetical protein